MQKWLGEILRCPSCGGELDVTVFKGSNTEIFEGLLLCRCQLWYPIIKEIPRMLLGKHRDDYSSFLTSYQQDIPKNLKSQYSQQITTNSQVKDTFFTIWERFPTFGINDKGKQKFYDKWTAQKLGLRSIDELYSFISSKKLILEVGVGSGQKLKMMAEHSSGKVIGIDLISTVEHAADNTRKMPNVAVVQADLFALPFKKDLFDFIISDGVLHHTPDSKQAFLSIVPFLTKGGEIAIRVYRKGVPIREFCDDFIRSYTTKMSKTECWQFCEKISKLGESLAKTTCQIEIPEDIELLGFKRGKYDLQRFLYYNMFKCFYNEAFTPEENCMINFDWYSPTDAHRHTEEEVRQWFVEVGLHEIKLFNPESGISAIGKKP